MKQSALFISNSTFVNKDSLEGGVRQCSLEYLSLLNEVYDVTVFEVDYKSNIIFKICSRLNLNKYNYYEPQKYLDRIIALINIKNIEVVFLNLSNTSSFAIPIKNIFLSRVKIILCSHGNESGDYLHEVTRFNKGFNLINRFTSSYVLGSLLKREVLYRKSHLDAVLTVSPVEKAIEQWLGAKKIFMVPRTLNLLQVERKPLLGRVGFIGDLSHFPNRYGIEEVCEAISRQPNTSNIEIRVVGLPMNVGQRLSDKYSFVHYTGYLNNEDLINEVSSWTYFINPVFYYSRGVSTKLSRALGLQLPTITTSIGYRGYTWKEGELITAETPQEMANSIVKNALDYNAIEKSSIELSKVISTFPTLHSIACDLQKFIDSIE